ncbi:MAG: hypothetical protein AAF683_08425 [Pseudomonadota bacterium]
MEPVDWLPDWLAYPLYWIWLNQTLFAGALAAYAAWRTVTAIRAQIRQERELFERKLVQEKEQRADDLDRKLQASIAGLPLALTEINKYTELCILRLLQYVSDDGDVHGDINFDVEFDRDLQQLDSSRPIFPIEALRIVQSTIEYADLSDAKKMQTLISFAQIQKSRFESTLDSLHGDNRFCSAITNMDLAKDIRDALALQKIVSAAYGFARARDTNISNLCSNIVAKDLLLNYYNAPPPIVDYVENNWPPNSITDFDLLGQ